MSSLPAWQQILVILFYIGLYFFVKKFVVAKFSAKFANRSVNKK